MGLLSNLLNNREVNRLEELAVRSPAPSVFIRLSQLYRELGNQGRSADSIKRGIKYFPDNEELILANRELQKQEHSAEKQRLKLRIEQYPNPTLYSKLAGIYLAEEDFEECEHICKNCLHEFKDYGGIYFILAQLADKKGDDEECINMLLKTAEIDKFNYTALVMLAEKHKAKGDLIAAEKVLKDILEFSPDNQKVLDMLENIDDSVDIEAVSQEIENLTANNPSMIDKSKQPTARVDMDKRLNSSSSSSITGIDQLEKALTKLARVEGVQECILMDKSGLVIASSISDSDSEELYAALVTNIYMASDDCGEPLMLGGFEDGILESETGNIYLMVLNDILVAVFAAHNAKSGLLQRAIHNFAQKIVHG